MRRAEYAVDRALRAIERPVYGSSVGAEAEAAARPAFVAELDASRYEVEPHSISAGSESEKDEERICHISGMSALAACCL